MTCDKTRIESQGHRHSRQREGQEQRDGDRCQGLMRRRALSLEQWLIWRGWNLEFSDRASIPQHMYDTFLLFFMFDPINCDYYSLSC